MYIIQLFFEDVEQAQEHFESFEGKAQWNMQQASEVVMSYKVVPIVETLQMISERVEPYLFPVNDVEEYGEFASALDEIDFPHYRLREREDKVFIEVYPQDQSKLSKIVAAVTATRRAIIKRGLEEHTE